MPSSGKGQGGGPKLPQSFPKVSTESRRYTLMTETMQSFKTQMESARAGKPHTGWRGEPLPQAYWDRLKEDLARTEEEWDALLASAHAQSQAQREKVRLKAQARGITLS